MSSGYPVPSARATFGSATVRLRLASVIESPWKRIVWALRGCAGAGITSPASAVPRAAAATSTNSRRVRSSGIGSGVSLRSSQSHPVDQLVEPLVPLQRVEQGIHREVHHPAAALRVCLLGPLEGGV